MKTMQKMLLWVLVPVMAVAVVWVLPARAANEEQAKKFVSTMADKVILIVQDASLSDAAKEDQLVKIFNDNVDTDWMGRFALGRYFTRLNDGEKKHYLKLYHDYLLNNYIPRFREYTGEKIGVAGASAIENGEVMVNTTIHSPKASKDVLVDYRLKQQGDSFRVVDIVAEGISLITTQRTDFGTSIANDGTEAFFARLEAKSKKSAAQ